MAESNNRIERLHGTEKERTKVTWAFDTDGGAAMIAEDLWVYYNLVKPHMGIGGSTPGDAAGVACLMGSGGRPSSTAPSPEKLQSPSRASVKSNHPIRGQSL